MCVGLARPDSAPEPESDAQFALGPDPTYLDLLGANVAAVEYEYEPTVVVREQVMDTTIVALCST